MSAGSPVVKRFDFGEVGAIVAASDRRLTDVDLDHAFFALKVVDQTDQTGRILGIAENIRPQRAGSPARPAFGEFCPLSKRRAWGRSCGIFTLASTMSVCDERRGAGA